MVAAGAIVGQIGAGKVGFAVAVDVVVDVDAATVVESELAANTDG